MSDTFLESHLPVGLVDPVLEASALSQPHGKQPSRRLQRPPPDKTEAISVHLSRVDKAASWGFLICSNTFPLQVGAITSDVASRLYKGDEILSINNMTPENYEDAIRQFQRARLNLVLRLRRSCGRKRQRKALEPCGSKTPDSCATLNVDAETPYSSSRTAASSSSSSPMAKKATPGTMPMPPSPKEAYRCPRGVVRQSAQMVLDKVLRSEKIERVGGFDLTDPPVGASMASSSSSPRAPPPAASKAFGESVMEAWQRVLSRKRDKFSRLNDECCLVDISTLLSRPTRQAIYDRHSCPFSAEEGFTTDFHNAVQYTMTQRALLYGRDTDAQSKGVTALSYRGGKLCNPAALVGCIEAKTAECGEEILKLREANGFSRRGEELETLHGAMLRIAASCYASTEEMRRVEVEKYSQIERAAQEFFSAYTEATLLSSAMTNSKPQSHMKHSYANTGGYQRHKLPHPQSAPVAETASVTTARWARGGDGPSSQLMRLPTPPPPPPPPPLR